MQKKLEDTNLKFKTAILEYRIAVFDSFYNILSMDDQRDSQKYPIGTIVYYGPDEDTTTKITASILLEEGAEPIRKHWTGEEVTTDTLVISELGQFFKEYGILRVVMTSRNAGCPHVAGVDYPKGQDCPFCPYWAGKQ